ncbi:group II truncated hemoglobin [soil metagenome]
MQHYEPVMAGTDGATSSPPSLFDWAGGREALEALFEQFYDRVLADDLLYPLFKDMDPNHPQHVAMWVGEVFGGPPVYSADRGGHPAMLRHHLDREITEAQRRRWIDLLVDAAGTVGLPDDAEFRAAFMGYIEWGTRLAKLFSQSGASPNFDEPVPTWQWTRPPWQA